MRVLNWHVPTRVPNTYHYTMDHLTSDELNDIYAFAVELGKRAGTMLKDAAQLRMSGGSGTREEKAHVQKENAVDLVTETDEGRSRTQHDVTFDKHLSSLLEFQRHAFVWEHMQSPFSKSRCRTEDFESSF